jgi:hypothetical protein
VALGAGRLPLVLSKLLEVRVSRLAQPGGERPLLEHLDLRVHDGVLGAAVLRALAVERTGSFRLELEHVHLAGDGIALSGQLGDPPAVVDVAREELEADRTVDR